MEKWVIQGWGQFFLINSISAPILCYSFDSIPIPYFPISLVQ